MDEDSDNEAKKKVTEKDEPTLLNTTVIQDIPPVHHNEHSIEYLNNERSTTIRNDPEIAEFLTSVEEHQLPQFRRNWKSHFSNVQQIAINPDSNSHSCRYYRNADELSRFVNSHTLYRISEEEEDQHQPSQNPVRTFPRRNREVWFMTNPHYRQPEQNPYSIALLRLNNSNRNVSLAPSQFHNNLGAHLTNLPHQEVVENEPQRSLIVQLPNQEINLDLHLIQNYSPNNTARAVNYSIEQDAVLNRATNNIINIPEFHIYQNAALNALAHGNSVINELYQIILRHNVLQYQNILEQNNNDVINGIPNVEVGRIQNIQVRPNNLMPILQNPILPNFFEQIRRQGLPFVQLVFVANRGINPLHGGHNEMIRYIQSNPNVLLINVRNVILIVHPSILEGNNNLLIQQNQWIPARALLRENNVAVENAARPNPNNQDFDEEAGPSNERDKHSQERKR